MVGTSNLGSWNSHWYYGGFHSHGVPQERWMVYFIKIPSVSGWFGGTPILGNLYIYPIDPNVTFESVEQLCDNQVNLNHESLPYVSLFPNA